MISVILSGAASETKKVGFTRGLQSLPLLVRAMIEVDSLIVIEEPEASSNPSSRLKLRSRSHLLNR